jgi:CDP-glycerol glycerophosphotransferase (TagB/SpsB family)
MKRGDPIAVKKLEKYDYILLSGPKNRFRLEEIGVNRKEERYISMGCLRFDKLLSGGFDRSRTEKDLGISYSNRNTLLYAPTWQFGQGTFKRYAHKLVLFSKARYNLILRPHYHDRKYGYGLYVLTQCLIQKQVRYASPTDLILKDTFACFSASDLLISDNSSVVYEYLIMGKPILLLENSFDKRHKMPDEMDIRNIAYLHRPGQSLQKSIDHAVETFDPQSYRNMLETCFYNFQGGALKVAHEFFQSIL